MLGKSGSKEVNFWYNSWVKKTKILFVDHTPFPGGAQICLASHLKCLDQDRFQPFLTIAKSSKYDSIYHNCNVPIYRIDFEQLKKIELPKLKQLGNSVQQFRALVKFLEPEIVVANTTRALIVAAMAKGDFRLISYVRDYDYPRWLMKIFSTRADKILAVSRSVAEYYGGEKKWEVVYLGSDMKDQLASVKKGEAAQLKKGLGIDASDIVIGYAGRLVGWKGPQVLVEAVSKIADSRVKLVLFGSGKGQPGCVEGLLRKQIKKYQYKLEHRVKMAGFIEKRPLIYQSLDIFVLPSQDPEPFATNVIEAALTGLPIIATDSGGTAEFIRDGKNGLLVKPGDSDELAAALVRLIKSASLRKSLGKKAKLDAAAFTEVKLASRLERIYRSLI